VQSLGTTTSFQKVDCYNAAFEAVVGVCGTFGGNMTDRHILLSFGKLTMVGSPSKVSDEVGRNFLPERELHQDKKVGTGLTCHVP